MKRCWAALLPMQNYVLVMFTVARANPIYCSQSTVIHNAARFAPWVVLIDLNGDGNCAPEVIHNWLPNPSEHMFLRIAVRAAEAWILADRERIASWLGLSVGQIPINPDELSNPKQELINLARRTPRRWLRNEIVPRESSGRMVGPLYTSRMMQFIQDKQVGWRPGAARLVSQSSGSLHQSIEITLQSLRVTQQEQQLIS